MKILILKPSSLGDVVQAMPVLRLLKRHWPESDIFWWIDAGLASLLEGDPDLAGIVRFERRRWTSPANWPEVWHSVRWMRRQEFDLVIDLQCLFRSGMFAWLANGKLLVGLDTPREGARGFYDLIVRRDSFYTHAADWYLALLKALNVPTHWDFEWLPERRAVSAEIKRKWQPDSARWIVLQPGARWLNKRWPVENFAALVRQLAAARPEVRFAILGSGDDKEAGSIIASAEPERCLDLTGKISLPEMIEWIRLGKLMISNDTGPMHVAAAIGKPVLAIFGPTEPRRTGPYRQLQNVIRVELPCAPCLKSHCTYEKPLECLKTISPEMVFERAIQLV
ncbi:MAG TPA: lipopolysaccharide heptosyltransferase II [Candidatus Angelobacter sp.]|nr:lipopolysaccharide heptosyltransferase II [Candidatus Angelobacter sp.]